eukprot:377606_1
MMNMVSWLFVVKNYLSVLFVDRIENVYLIKLSIYHENIVVVVRVKVGSIDSAFNARNAFVKLAANKMNDIFSKMSSINGNKINLKKSSKDKKRMNGMINVCGIILAGNGPLKSQLYQSPFLRHYIKSSVLSIEDINYGGKFGFYECIKKCNKLLKMDEFEKENDEIKNINNLIYENTNIVSIGFD